ncbi:MAG: hypothetical protein K6347_08360 [Campylobacterales bacterium]
MLRAVKLTLAVITCICLDPVYGKVLELKSGWNLVGTNSKMSLESILTQIPKEDLLVIQGDQKVYKKLYEDNASLKKRNTFTAFEIGRGYWIKLNRDHSLIYDEDPLSGLVSIPLKAGWNLIDPLADMNLNEIISQIEYPNLLVIQGQVVVYKKLYAEIPEFTKRNTFDKFEDKAAYWIKVAKDANLTFDLGSGSETSDVLYPPQVPDTSSVEAPPMPPGFSQ